VSEQLCAEQKKLQNKVLILSFVNAGLRNYWVLVDHLRHSMVVSIKNLFNLTLFRMDSPTDGVHYP